MKRVREKDTKTNTQRKEINDKNVNRIRNKRRKRQEERRLTIETEINSAGVK